MTSHTKAAKLHRNNSDHLYIQLRTLLEREVSRMKPGDRFYSDDQVCQRFRVSKPTARAALSILMDEGVIERMPYRGTFVARGESRPAARKNMRVGVISRLDYYYPQVRTVQGVENSANRDGYSTLVADWKPEGGAEPACRELPVLMARMTRREVDGIIIVSPIKQTDREAPPCLRRPPLPTVLVNWTIADVGIPAVLANYEEGAYKLTTHLIEHGCDSIGFFGGDLSRQAFIDRLNGFRRAMRDKGMKENPAFVRDGMSMLDESEPRALLAKLISSRKYPRAVVTVTDRRAMALIEAIKEQGLRVPEDIAVTGFDDDRWAHGAEPPLTTAPQPYYELGVNAMELLRGMIEGRNPGGVKMYVPCDPIIRESCGCGKKD